MPQASHRLSPCRCDLASTVAPSVGGCCTAFLTSQPYEPGTVGRRVAGERRSAGLGAASIRTVTFCRGMTGMRSERCARAHGHAWTWRRTKRASRSGRAIATWAGKRRCGPREGHARRAAVWQRESVVLLRGVPREGFKVDRAKERAKAGGVRSSASVERDVDSENTVTLPRTRWTSCQPTTW